MLTIILTSHNKSSTKYLDFKASIPPQAVGQIGGLFINLFFTLHLFSFHLILEVRVLYKLQYFCRQNFTPTFIFYCHSLIWLSPSHTHKRTIPPSELILWDYIINFWNTLGEFHLHCLSSHQCYSFQSWNSQIPL